VLAVRKSNDDCRRRAQRDSRHTEHDSATAGDRNGRIENLLAATEKRDAAMETLKGQWHVYIKTLPRK
jgi:hypothetical protein